MLMVFGALAYHAILGIRLDISFHALPAEVGSI